MSGVDCLIDDMAARGIIITLSNTLQRVARQIAFIYPPLSSISPLAKVPSLFSTRHFLNWNTASNAFILDHGSPCGKLAQLDPCDVWSGLCRSEIKDSFPTEKNTRRLICEPLLPRLPLSPPPPSSSPLSSPCGCDSRHCLRLLFRRPCTQMLAPPQSYTLSSDVARSLRRQAPGLSHRSCRSELIHNINQ